MHTHLSYTPSIWRFAGVSSVTVFATGLAGYGSTCSGEAVKSSFCLGGVVLGSSSTTLLAGELAMNKFLSTTVDSLGVGVG